MLDATNVNNDARELGKPQIGDEDEELRVDMVARREACGIQSVLKVLTIGC